MVKLKYYTYNHELGRADLNYQPPDPESGALQLSYFPVHSIYPVRCQLLFTSPLTTTFEGFSHLQLKSDYLYPAICDAAVLIAKLSTRPFSDSSFNPDYLSKIQTLHNRCINAPSLHSPTIPVSRKSFIISWLSGLEVSRSQLHSMHLKD